MPDAVEEASDDEESLKKERKVDSDEKGAIKAKKDADKAADKASKEAERQAEKEDVEQEASRWRRWMLWRASGCGDDGVTARQLLA